MHFWLGLLQTWPSVYCGLFVSLIVFPLWTLLIVIGIIEDSHFFGRLWKSPQNFFTWPRHHCTWDFQNDTPWTQNQGEQERSQAFFLTILMLLPVLFLRSVYQWGQVQRWSAMTLKLQEIHKSQPLLPCPVSLSLRSLVVELYSSSQHSKQKNPVTAFIAKKGPPQFTCVAIFFYSKEWRQKLN